jgi:hypothetical protein
MRGTRSRKRQKLLSCIILALSRPPTFLPLGLFEVICETYRPLNFEYLQENIHDSTTHITPETLERVLYYIAASYQSVLATDGTLICTFSSLKLFL